MGKRDVIVDRILSVLNSSNEPLETKEVEAELSKTRVKGITRTKVFYRLNILRGDGKIKGKFTGPGKGVWIWWRTNAFGK